MCDKGKRAGTLKMGKTRLLLVRSPLIGIPRSLPLVNRLHHSVVITQNDRMAPVDRNAPLDEGDAVFEPEHTFLLDVLPSRPTSFGSLVSLVAGHTIPAICRCKRLKSPSRRGFLDNATVFRSCTVAGTEPMELVNEARRFQGAYHDGEPTINLYTSNCVGFATCVIFCVIEAQFLHSLSRFFFFPPQRATLSVNSSNTSCS